MDIPQEPKYAKISGTGTDPVEVVAVVADRSIRVMSYVVCSAQAVTVTFKSATTALTGDMNSGDLEGNLASTIASGFNQLGQFQTAKGEALNIVGGGSGYGGHLTYIEV